MEEYVPVSHEPMEVCAVFIKEESPEELENTDVVVEIERDFFEESDEYAMANNPIVTDSGTFMCEICTKEFTQKRYLTAHRWRHPEFKKVAMKLKKEKELLEQAKNSQDLSCMYCKKVLSSRSTLNRHMKIHTGDKPVAKNFVCDICHKAFAHKRDVRVHLRVHTGEKPFKCKICGNRFSQRASLQYHVLGHSKHKPFPCDLCNKEFLRRISLERHKQVHSGIRPFKCHLCEKAFTQNRHLVAHIRIHNERKRNKRKKC